MNTFLTTLVIGTMIFILIIYAISIASNKKQTKSSPKSDAKKDNDRVDLDQLEKTLNFMLQNGVITAQEYSKLLGKSLPFV